jgi:hypothetical protein
VWKHRRKIIEAINEIGCGMLTVLFITIPVWALTISWRGPIFAFGALAILLLVVVGMGLFTLWTGWGKD